ncbi:MAG: serine--tRNA ligase [Lentisphaerae bacterium RIFOXYA12_FULL_48_11]|nr:MAG: serine--tRNA ligase [Lentisphaerae bacterium RIFOXYA12_FULL_48_11]
MLDIKRIRENEKEVRQGLKNRGADTTAIDKVTSLDKDRRKLLTDVEALKNRRNVVSKEIGVLKKKGENTDTIQAEMRDLGNKITAIDVQVREIDVQLDAQMLLIPNIPHSSIPVGPDKFSNKVVREFGKPATFNFKPKTHVEIGDNLGIFDFDRATKMTGAGFPLFVGTGARLQRALISFMLDMHVKEHGYKELWPPAVCNSASMRGTGQLPKMAEDMYHVTLDDLWLIPTAEVPVTNYYRDEILDKPLPIYLTAYTSCFRREAGSAGKETRGLIRVHQFDKVEMVKFVEPETSYDELELLVSNAEDVLKRLGLHYRVLMLCSGDISFSAAKCYDIELWAPGQNDWLEVSSCSNFEDFQARRANIKYRKDGKARLVHTLNGSGVALARLVVAILENYQQADGSVVIPEALVPYMGGITKLEKT